MSFMDNIKKYLVTNKETPEMMGENKAPTQGGSAAGLTGTFEPTRKKTVNKKIANMFDTYSRQNPYYDVGETMDAKSPVEERPTGMSEHIANLRKQMQKNKPPFKDERYV